MLNKQLEVWANVKSNTKNRLGQYPVEDTHIETVYGCIIPQTGSLLRGREAETTLSKTTHKIVIRYRTDITPDMWFIYEGQRYNILYVMDSNLDHERLEIFCEVVV
jgi:head-tail adaptor